MKKYLLISLAVWMLSGCAALRTASDNYTDCLNDPICAQKVETTTQGVTSISGVVGGVLGSPMSFPIAALVSTLTALFAGIYFGRKKAKSL